MSKEELVGTYLAGRISRRMFVRGLVATGVSVGAALTYAEVLAGAISGPSPRAQQVALYAHYNHYNHYEPGTGVSNSGASRTARFTG
jgi:hypothetical protein